MKVQADTDAAAAAQHAAAEEAAVRQILRKYSIADVDIKALLEWKHTHYVGGFEAPGYGTRALCAQHVHGPVACIRIACMASCAGMQQHVCMLWAVHA